MTALERRKFKNNKCATPFCRNERGKNRKICYKCMMRKYKESRPVRYTYNALKQNAKRRGHGFDISYYDFLQFCKETGYLEMKGRNANSASIDRIDRNRGYSAGNIQVLSLSQNSVKENTERYCPF